MTTDITLRGLAAAEPSRTPVRGPARDTDPIPVAAAQAAALPNPNMRLDSSLGMVVIEFRSASGEVEASIPTPREIAAYRVAAMSNKEVEPVVATTGKAPPVPPAGQAGGAEAPEPAARPVAPPTSSAPVSTVKSHSL